ncbi:hypothetical protein BDR05DRAFT_959360 [Suillus weaverae]|nr:hypothetical protein BDR05DRAFT_959360 [Suillus weaverae]
MRFDNNTRSSPKLSSSPFRMFPRNAHVHVHRRNHTILLPLKHAEQAVSSLRKVGEQLLTKGPVSETALNVPSFWGALISLPMMKRSSIRMMHDLVRQDRKRDITNKVVPSSPHLCAIAITIGFILVCACG